VEIAGVVSQEINPWKSFDLLTGFFHMIEPVIHPLAPSGTCLTAKPLEILITSTTQSDIIPECVYTSNELSEVDYQNINV